MANTPHIGWSGAPGSRGSCSVTCHFRQHFIPSVTIEDFPEYYEPNQTYIIEISHTGDSSIKNFNASIRIGTGSDNGGIIQSGTNTAVYYDSQETNGVHWSGSSYSSGTFEWIAPESGSGDVRLHYAGLQGSLSNGASFDTMLTSVEMTVGVDYTPQTPQLFELQQNYPNPFNGETIIKARIFVSGEYKLSVISIIGQAVYGELKTIDNPVIVQFVWNSNDNNGISVPSGVYFYRVTGNEVSKTLKMILLK